MSGTKYVKSPAVPARDEVEPDGADRLHRFCQPKELNMWARRSTSVPGRTEPLGLRVIAIEGHGTLMTALPVRCTELENTDLQISLIVPVLVKFPPLFWIKLALSMVPKLSISES